MLSTPRLASTLCCARSATARLVAVVLLLTSGVGSVALDGHYCYDFNFPLLFLFACRCSAVRWRGGWIEPAQHHTLPTRLVLIVKRRVGGITHLHQQSGPCFVTHVPPRAVNCQIAEEEHIARFRGAGHRCFEWILTERQVPPTALFMLQGT